MDLAEKLTLITEITNTTGIEELTVTKINTVCGKVSMIKVKV
jgi:hypothetical protein